MASAFNAQSDPGVVFKSFSASQQVRNSALYNADEPVYMEFGKEETCNVVSVSENQIKGESLDTVVGDEPVGFIKIDIEGSEMNALEGAKNTIIKQQIGRASCRERV